MTAVNQKPIFSAHPDNQASALIAAVNAVLYNAAGTVGTDIYLIHTADTGGGFIQRIHVEYVANAATASNACVMHFFLSTKIAGQATTDADTFQIGQMNIPAMTPAAAAAHSGFDFPVNFGLKGGQTLLCKITVAQPASCGFVATAIGGTYTA